MRNLVSPLAKTGSVVAGVIALAYLLQQIDTDTGWTDSLSAIGTVGATAAALFIATRDRSERKSEQLDADRAQARLVLLEVDGPYFGENDRPPHFIVHVEDNGKQPILDVTLESAAYTDESHSVALVGLAGALVPIVRPERAPGTLPASFPAADSSAVELFASGVIDEYGNFSNPDLQTSHVTATVQFTDASGNRWRRSTTGSPKLIKKG